MDSQIRTVITFKSAAFNGWYLDFEVAGASHTFVIGYRPGDECEAGTWIGWLERSRGFIGSVLGRRNRGIHAEAAETIHEVLSSSPQITDVRWHFQSAFDRGREELGASSPQAPR